MSLITANEFNNLKQQIQAECITRRKAANTIPEDVSIGQKMEANTIKNTLLPLNALVNFPGSLSNNYIKKNEDNLPVELIDNLQGIKAYSINNIDSIVKAAKIQESHNNTDCRGSCFGLCTSCTGNCSTTCSGTCSTTCTSCTGSCTGCGNECSGCGDACGVSCGWDCSGSCDSQCWWQ